MSASSGWSGFSEAVPFGGWPARGKLRRLRFPRPARCLRGGQGGGSWVWVRAPPQESPRLVGPTGRRIRRRSVERCCSDVRGASAGGQEGRSSSWCNLFVGRPTTAVSRSSRSCAAPSPRLSCRWGHPTSSPQSIRVHAEHAHGTARASPSRSAPACRFGPFCREDGADVLHHRRRASASAHPSSAEASTDDPIAPRVPGRAARSTSSSARGSSSTTSRTGPATSTGRRPSHGRRGAASVVWS